MAGLSYFVAADLYGQKVNLDVAFDVSPSVAQLSAAVQATMANEAAVLRPPGAVLHVFVLAKLQAFSAATGRWRDLTGSAALDDLRPGTQLYAFQASPTHSESQQQIPPPRRPSATVGTSGGAPTSPARARASLPSNAAALAAATDAAGGNQHLSSPTRPPVTAASMAAAGELSATVLARRHAAAPAVAAPAALSPPRGTVAGGLPADITPFPPAAAADVTAVTPSAIPWGSLHKSAAPLAAAPSFATVAPTAGPSFLGTTTAATGPVPRAVTLAASNPGQSLGQRLQFVHEELCRGEPALTLERWRGALRELQVDLPDGSPTELFRAFDADRDGVLSFAELCAMAEALPTLADALVHRLSDAHRAGQFHREISDIAAEVEAAVAMRGQAAAAADDSTAAAQAEAGAVVAAAAERDAAMHRDRELRRVRAECAADLDVAGGRRRDADVAVDRCREAMAAESRASVRVQEERAAGEAEVEAATRAAVGAAEVEARLRQQLEDAIAARAHAEQALSEATGRAHAAAAAETEAQRSVAAAMATVDEAAREAAAAEREELLMQQRQAELDRAVEDAAGTAKRAEADCSARERDAEAARERVALSAGRVSEAAGAVARAEERLASRQREKAAFEERRAATVAEERMLLGEELRLRAQRESLSVQERRHRHDATMHFDAVTGAPVAAAPPQAAPMGAPAIAPSGLMSTPQRSMMATASSLRY